MRHMEMTSGQLMPVGIAPPMLVGYSASSPGAYCEYDPATLTAKECPFMDSLKIDGGSPSTTLDTDGITYIGA